MTISFGTLTYEIILREGTLVLNGRVVPAILDHEDRRITLSASLGKTESLRILASAFEDIWKSRLRPVPMLGAVT